MPAADWDREGLQKEQTLWEVNKKSVFLQKEKVMREHASRYNKNQNPVKTTPLPATIKLDNIHLTEHIESLQELALVGRWHFSEMDDARMRKWLGVQWKPLIGYIPIVSNLMKEWYCFHFLSSSDIDTIQKRPWAHRRSFLALYRWYIGYNPLKNTPSNNLIWVKLPGLPLELWSKETLIEIGNAIGRFVYVDPRCLGEKDKRIAWILIEKAYRGGFPDHIEIAWRDLKINQRLDFWGIPFRCLACHRTGHLIKHCPRRPAHEKIWADTNNYKMYPQFSEKEKLSPTVSLTLLDHDAVQEFKNLENKISQSPQYFSQDFSQSHGTMPERSTRIGSIVDKKTQAILCPPPLEPIDEK